MTIMYIFTCPRQLPTHVSTTPVGLKLQYYSITGYIKRVWDVTDMPVQFSQLSAIVVVHLKQTMSLINQDINVCNQCAFFESTHGNLICTFNLYIFQNTIHLCFGNTINLCFGNTLHLHFRNAHLLDLTATVHFCAVTLYLPV